MNTLPYTWSDFSACIALVVIAVIIMMADAFCKTLPRRLYAIVGGLGLLAVGLFFGISDSFLSGNPVHLLGNIACVAGGFCLLFAFDYASVTTQSVTGSESEEGTGELYALFLIAIAGICALARAKDLITLFVSLEVITLSSYVMVGYYRRNRGSIEAGVKYLVQGALSTGILVFGLAWYFGSTGSFSLDPATAPEQLSQLFSVPAMQFAVILVSLGILFKIGAIPMSSWIPDVYQGAPTPVTAFLSTCSKIAGVMALLLVYNASKELLPLSGASATTPVFSEVVPALHSFLILVTVATLLVGNLAAINQSNAKRLLAYSSIGQAGFVLVFFVAQTDLLAESKQLGSGMAIYLGAYALAAVASFIAIGVVRMARQSEEISAFDGLGETNPYFAFAITLAMASLAGVPLTAGFMGKLISFITAVQTNVPDILLIAMIIAAAVGFYYYFKILRAMYWESPAEGAAPVKVPTLSAILLGVLSLGILVMGCGLLAVV